MIDTELLRDPCARTATPVLSFDSARSLAVQHGTPLLVTSRSRLVRNYWEMKQAMPGVDLYYAAKANPAPVILEALAAEKAFVDVCSAGEMVAALAAGFTPDRMLHTHPCKTEDNFRQCYDAGLRWFVYDSESEAEKIASWSTDVNLTSEVNLLLRLAITAQSSKINLSAKFGAPVEDVASLLEAASRRRLNVRGFSFHVGSQCVSPEDYCIAIAKVREVWDLATRMGFVLSVLDIGGGFPAPYRDDVPSTDSFCGVIWRGLQEHFGRMNVRFLAEPGRGLCAESTTLVTKVIGKSKRWGMPWYFIDDGIYNSFSGIMFDHGDFPILFESSGDRPVAAGVIAGPTCDSGDVVCRDQEMPDLEVGELLMVPCMGAYAGASACPFNGLPVAKSVLIA
ncbi:type III PLP-dependent enzyme [Novipirellula artificiosorum]|uniref:Lysine/ornithine decarboxylase n=1 Tax=Novipirellula artificiosorum TaxID=2528016 RepID=A0A5C6DP35_9BACT|nr:type III PLP-dependent enzyme [Novipirellula artificiosorum]TWU37411.1 Lysine/ornithine decarboxylase [Novipirellula artificiosorum]